MPEIKSMNEVTQTYLEDAMDSGQNIVDAKVRKEILEKIKTDYPKWNESSITSSMSKSKNKIAKNRNIKPSDLGVGNKKPLFDDALNLTVDKTGSVESEGLATKNPKFKKDENGKPIIKKETESPLTEKAFEGMGSIVYDFASYNDEYMEDLDDEERKIIGETLKPIADKYFYGEKSTIIIALGSMMGLFMRKKKDAKRKREKVEGKSKNKSWKEKIAGNKKPKEKLTGTTTEEPTEPKIKSEGGK